MKIIKNSKDITTLEIGDVVVFDGLEHVVDKVFKHNSTQYYLYYPAGYNGTIFEKVNLKKGDFVEKLGIDANCNCDFPEVKSLEALTAIVSALFKEYENQNTLPKTWEEFCKRAKIKEGESYIDCSEQDTIEVDSDNVGIDRDSRMDKNLCTSKPEAKAFLALMQLRQLRKAYVKDWEPDWNNNKQWKACILYHGTDFMLTYFRDACSRPLSFPTQELAEQFLNNFKDLLEIAKPLL
jgi:hypothetical protein